MESSTENHSTKISVIIPFFNAERHLLACLESAASQTLPDCEFICVDDCSTDSSRQLVLDFIASDTRFRLIEHDSNRGEGCARNSGLDAALGDYIFHLDADDDIPAGALETLYSNAIDNNSDIVKGGYIRVFQDGSSEQIRKSTPERKIINTTIYESDFLKNIPSSHCSYLYRRELLDRHQIRYRTDLCIGLDLIALATALCKARSVTLLTEPVYHYHQTDDSAVRGLISKKMPLDAIQSLSIVVDSLNQHGIVDAARHRLTMWRHHIENFWLRAAWELSRDDCVQIFEEFRNLVTADIIPWNVNTPLRHRYILALLLAREDDEVIEFLRTQEASHGFSDSNQSREAFEFILTRAPDDIKTLYSLGRLELADDNTEKAIALFEKVLESDSKNIDARLKLIVALRRSGRLRDASSAVKSIENTLITCVMSEEQVEILRKEKNRLVLRNMDYQEGEVHSVKVSDCRTNDGGIYESRELRELIDIKTQDIKNLFEKLSKTEMQVEKFQKRSRRRQNALDALEKKVLKQEERIRSVENSLTYKLSHLLNRAIFKPGLNTLLLPIHCFELIYTHKASAIRSKGK